MVARPSSQGVFCLEGEWDDDLRDESTVLPLLELLDSAAEIPFVHRRVTTKVELQARLRWWLDVDSGLEVLYLASHGRRATLELGGDDVTLDNLAGMLDDRVADSIIYFGGCTTLAGDEQRAQEFCEKTGARAVVGYSRQIPWVLGASFELALLPELVTSVRMPALFDRMTRDFPTVTTDAGFRVATASWVGTANRRM